MNDIISVFGTMALGFFFASWLVARYVYIPMKGAELAEELEKAAMICSEEK